MVRGVYLLELCKLLCKQAQVEHLAGDPDAAGSSLVEAEAIARQLGAGSDSELGQALSQTRSALG